MILLFLCGEPALAELPLPTYPQCGEPDRTDLCPRDLDGDWQMISWIPAGSRDTVRPEELELGSGNRVDRALRVTAGRWDVLLSMADSGLDWADGAYSNKIFVNVGELPLPQDETGAEAADYDLDANGLVNVQDWASDPRVGVAAGRDMADGLLDASDLVYAFSDGVDDDGNGFVDDIAGWDFFDDDNDPYHEYTGEFGDHGGGVVEEMAAEGNDDHGDIGVCPNCPVLPIRIGDTFITDGSRVGMAIVYATDMGAKAINLSVGALTGPGFARDAAAYARSRGVSLVGAAGDENAYHHNQPAMYDGFLYVKSIHPDVGDEYYGAYSYLNFFNCNNYGPRVDLSADTPACATGATAITTGTVGMVHSIARDKGIELSADEVWQIVTRSATDIHLSAEEVAEAQTYPSQEGWDLYFGYGRVNVEAAVTMVRDGRIPPAMDIAHPGWFQAYPSSGSLPIEGYIAADRSTGFDWVVELGTGADPRAWTELASGHSTSRIDGTLASVDLSAIATAAVPEPALGEGVVDRVKRVMAPSVTVRVRATDDDGNEGQFRKTFFVHDDPDLVAGFPLDLGESGESSPLLADLDGDDVFEIVIATSGGYVHAFTADGSELAGWPVQTPVIERLHAGQAGVAAIGELHDGFTGTAAVGDIDGDGAPEVVAASGTGWVYAWHADGSGVAGFPVAILGRERGVDWGPEDAYDEGFAGGPSLYDLDDDGAMEIVASAMDGRVYAWDGAGADWGPYPVELCVECEIGTRSIVSPAIGDVDGDGDPDLGLANNETANNDHDSVSWVLDARTAVPLPGWPLEESGLVNRAGLLPLIGEGHPASLAFADLDGDGTLEVSSAVMLGTNPLYRHDASPYLDLSYVASAFGENHDVSETSLVTMTTNPAFGDMTGDGVPDYLISGTGLFYLLSLPASRASDFQHLAGGWDGATGEMLPGFPRQIEDLQFLVAPAVADITGDGRAEAIFGSAGFMLHAWDSSGAVAPGWPKFTGNWILGSPAVGDLDGDGYVEVVVSTREGHVFAWRTQGRADQHIGWAMMHHDAQNTGNHETPLPAQVGPPPVPPACIEGQCCCGSARGAVGFAALAPLLALAARRRR